MERLLVVGAGATIEECKRSGNFPNDPNKLFPSIKNFCNKFFSHMSDSLFFATASYLDIHGIDYDKKLVKIMPNGKIPIKGTMNIKDGDQITDEDIAQSPIGIFLKMEQINPDVFNIERLAEFVWNEVGNDEAFWRDFVYSGIYYKLQWLFYYQFGSGIGNNMGAGKAVAKHINNYDVVINLNYDIAFDLALKQSGKSICYAPLFKENSVYVLKPHGSINLYINNKNKKWFFTDPDKMAGSVSIDRGEEGIFDPFEGLLPPRLNKNYSTHPMAKSILGIFRTYNPKFLTFWGIGFTESDADLLNIYREAARHAKVIEFINPDEAAYIRASSLLGKEVKWFQGLKTWLSQFNELYFDD